MCGRYSASRRPEDLAGIFEIEKWDPEERLATGYDAGSPAGGFADYNVAPTKEVWAVLDRKPKATGDAGSAGSTGETAPSGDPAPVRQLRKLNWGLVPSWAKTPEGAARMINARAETLHEKPAYRKAFTQRRCILPADGYYEWVTGSEERALEVEGRKKRPRKQPYFVTPADGSVFAMAGIYEFWRDRTLPDGHPAAWRVTCSVITTEAETTPLAAAPAEGPRALADIHPRMPLMLTADHWDEWLDPARTDTAELRALLEPPPAGLLRAFPVPTAVSNVRNNGPELLEELAAPEETTLF